MVAVAGRSTVAVVMPAWNAERHIAEAIASALAQRDAADLEIHVVDDGSTDDTRAIVQELAANASEIRLIETPHRGISPARNAGLAAISSDAQFVTFLDADDLMAPGRLARDLSHFARDPAVDVVWCRARRFFDPDAVETAPHAASPSHLVRGALVGNLLIRSDVASGVGKFDETLVQAEDFDFVMRLLERRPNAKLIDDVGLLYRRHSSNTTLDLAASRAGRTRAYMLAARRRREGAPSLPRGLLAEAVSEPER